jgi:TBC1 domain family member 15
MASQSPSQAGAESSEKRQGAVSDKDADPSSDSSSSSFHLLYSKSKVYVHPTPYARDNIVGWVALLRKGPPRPCAGASNIYFAYMPESLLVERDELDVFVSVERDGSTGELEGRIHRDQGE